MYICNDGGCIWNMHPCCICMYIWRSCRVVALFPDNDSHNQKQAALLHMLGFQSVRSACCSNSFFAMRSPGLRVDNGLQIPEKAVNELQFIEIWMFFLYISVTSASSVSCFIPSKMTRIYLSLCVCMQESLHLQHTASIKSRLWLIFRKHNLFIQWYN